MNILHEKGIGHVLTKNSISSRTPLMHIIYYSVSNGNLYLRILTAHNGYLKEELNT